MSVVCFFDLIPVEILTTIFTYFCAHEILHSFSNISDHVNALLLIYSGYRLNFQSIKIFDFNLICRRIRPEQVIYLKLSDDNNTSGLSEHFFSQFQIEQFTQLRSLTLSEIELTSLESIFSNLHKLIHLRSISFNRNTTRYIFRGLETDGLNEINRISNIIYNSFTLIIPRLNRLHLGSNDYLKSIQFPYLLQLKLEKCSMDDLKIILLHASLLKSLDICLEKSELTCDFVVTSKQFTRLHLKIDNTLISMNAIEQFLSKLIYLKHLVLETHGTSDILNTQRWENVTSNLIIFNFKFYMINCSNRNLDLFRTSFWLEEKHWFVASNSNSIFSIPYFSPSKIFFPGPPFIDSTAPNDQIFYDQITKFTIVNNVPHVNNYYCFTHIKILNIRCSISLKALLSLIDLHEIERLYIPSINDILIFNPLVSTMPKLYYLSINQPITKNQIKEIQGYQFKQIQYLIISIDYTNQNYIIEVLFRLFPRTKRLTFLTCIMSIDIIMRLIDGFNDLSHVSFYSYSSFQTTENIYCLDSKLYIPEKRIFTSRVYYSLNNLIPFHINLWLKEESTFSQIIRIVQRHLSRCQLHLDNVFNITIVLFIRNLFVFLYKDTVQTFIDIGLIRYTIFIGFLFFISAKFTRYLPPIFKFCVLCITILYYYIK